MRVITGRAARRQLVHNGDIQITVHHQCEGAGDRRSGHHQQVRGSPAAALADQPCALAHAEAVLLVGNAKPEVSR